jgi:hypothetical protein
MLQEREGVDGTGDAEADGQDANEKLAHRRLTVLAGRATGGIDRTSVYDWKRRFQLEGLDG